MSLHGIYQDRIARDNALAKLLRADDMERFRAVPKTVMINQWQDDLDWLIVDRSYPGQISRRLELLRTWPEMVIDRLPGEDVRRAELELRDMVVEFLLNTYPRYFRRDGDVLLSPLTGLAIDVGARGADPMVAVALLASEDMLLLLPEVGGAENRSRYLLKSGALCFPNDWSLRSHFNQPLPDSADPFAIQAWQAAQQKSLKAARLGKSPHEVHEGHVAHYTEHFSPRVDMFFDKMEPGMRTWRRNWGMRLTEELFLHSDTPHEENLPPLTPESWAKFGYLRSEHETFTKLPVTGGIVFTIKTYLWKLSDLVKNEAALQALLLADSNLAPGMFEYRAQSLPTFRSFLDSYRST